MFSCSPTALLGPDCAATPRLLSCVLTALLRPRLLCCAPTVLLRPYWSAPLLLWCSPTSPLCPDCSDAPRLLCWAPTALLGPASLLRPDCSAVPGLHCWARLLWCSPTAVRAPFDYLLLATALLSPTAPVVPDGFKGPIWLRIVCDCSVGPDCSGAPRRLRGAPFDCLLLATALSLATLSDRKKNFLTSPFLVNDYWKTNSPAGEFFSWQFLLLESF